MNNISAAAEKFLSRWIEADVTADSGAKCRPILVGPPRDALHALFDHLTANGTSDWSVSVSGATRAVVVLLVTTVRDSGPAPGTVPLSQHCKWDYAVNLRNSQPLVVMLAESVASDPPHDSLKNTTQRVGVLTLDRDGLWLQDRLWIYLVELVAAHLSLPATTIREALNGVLRQSDLDSATAERLPWEIVDALLATTIGTSTREEWLPFCAGLPCPSGAPIDITASLDVLKQIGRFFGSEGVAGGITKLKGTQVANALGLAIHLDALEAHLNTQMLSGVAFSRAPAWSWRPRAAVPSWWSGLTVDRLAKMLGEVITPPPRNNKLRLICVNAVNATARADSEPCVVRGRVDLQAADSSGATLPTVAFARSLPRTAPYPLLVGGGSSTSCADINPPPHETPLKY